MIMFLCQSLKIMPYNFCWKIFFCIFPRVNHSSVLCIFFRNSQILAKLKSLLILLRTWWYPTKFAELSELSWCSVDTGIWSSCIISVYNYFWSCTLSVTVLICRPCCPSVTMPLCLMQRLKLCSFKQMRLCRCR